MARKRFGSSILLASTPDQDFSAGRHPEKGPERAWWSHNPATEPRTGLTHKA